MKTKKTSTEQRPRRTWVGYKPRKEATKKERIERALHKHKANYAIETRKENNNG